MVQSIAEIVMRCGNDGVEGDGVATSGDGGIELSLVY